MATYSSAPGIASSTVLETPTNGNTNSLTVPSNSYALISVYCDDLEVADGDTGTGTRDTANSYNAGNFGLAHAVVAAGKQISVTTQQGVTNGFTFSKVTVAVGGVTVFKNHKSSQGGGDTTLADVQVHCIVFSAS